MAYSNLGGVASASGVVSVAGVRQTKPQDELYYQRGFNGIIPRRGLMNSPLLDAKTSLLRYSSESPLRVLSMLPDIHPSVGLATWNALRLACAADDLRIVAVSEESSSDGSDTDEAGTAAIDALWNSLPTEVGGLQGLQTTLTMQALFTGLVCVEAVPDVQGKGVRRVWPVDSLSIGFGRDEADADLTPYQRQINGPTPYVRLDVNRFFWRSVDTMVDDPYGRAPYATALSEVLLDLALIQDLRDAIHHAAWPRIQVGFNFTETFKIAVDVLGIRDPQEAAAFVQKEFAQVVEYVEKMKADDALVHDTNGTSNTIEGGKGFANLSEILDFLRNRLLQSLKTLPTLMGINDGSTQTYTTVEWRIYAEGLETLRGMVAELLVKVATLHLRLLGLPLQAKAELKRIRTSDELLDANTEAVRIQNAITKRDQAWLDQDQASTEITGSDAVGPAPVAVPSPTLPVGDPIPLNRAQEQKALITAQWRARRIEAERQAA